MHAENLLIAQDMTPGRHRGFGPFSRRAQVETVKPARQAEAPRTEFISLAAVASTLWRHQVLILLMLLLSTALGAYYAYIHATPTFRSTAVLVLNAREERVVDLDSVIGGLSAESSVVNTEVEVLRSRSLLLKLASGLDLQQDAEFNRFLRVPTVWESTKLQLKRGLGLTQPAPPLSPEDEDARLREATIDGLLDALTVRNVPQSLVFHVTAETSDAKKSARIANMLVELYILNQLEVKFEATEQATSWLTQRVADLQVALEDAEARVKDFRAKTDLVNSTALAALEIQLKDVRDRVAEAESLQLTAQRRIDGAKAETRAGIADAMQDARLTALLTGGASDGFASFDARVKTLVARSQAELSRARATLDDLAATQAELDATLTNNSADLVALDQLTREAEASRLLYDYFLGRLKETSAQQGIHQADSRILSNAVVPTRAATPQRPLILAMFALAGLVLGAAYALFREARADTFRTAKTLEEVAGHPVLGQIANMPRRRTKDAITYLADKPTSAAAEAIRNLRTSVLLSNIDRPPKVIMISSSLPDEGKTTVALTLAQNLVGMGKRVLLVEGDIRRQAFKDHIGVEKTGGLLSVLSGDRSLSSVIFNDPLTGADILQGEQSNASAADLFSSDKFRALVADLRKSYDQIIIDTPPVLVVPDARIIAQVVDSVLFVVKWDATRKNQVTQALELFESIHLRISGLVLNQISRRGMRRYGYSSQFGGYGAFGRHYYVD